MNFNVFFGHRKKNQIWKTLSSLVLDMKSCLCIFVGAVAISPRSEISRYEPPEVDHAADDATEQPHWLHLAEKVIHSLNICHIILIQLFFDLNFWFIWYWGLILACYFSNGNTWNYEYVPSTKMFSTTDKSIMNSQMRSLYRYYGTKIYYWDDENNGKTSHGYSIARRRHERALPRNWTSQAEGAMRQYFCTKMTKL